MKTAGQAGFTLVEILIAVAVFAFGILAIATMQAWSIRGNASSQTITEAGNLASCQIERLMALDYMHADLNDSDNDGNAGLDHTGTAADHQRTEGRYVIFWNVAQDVPITNNKTLNIIIRWTERKANKTYSVRAIKAR
jgi:prepilin-type N-terminal cleavage/methylation domain-containing protein